jgi:hypothetical protein
MPNFCPCVRVSDVETTCRKCHEVPILRTIEDYVLCLPVFAKNSTRRIEHEWTLPNTVYPGKHTLIFACILNSQLEKIMGVCLFKYIQLCWIKICLRRRQPPSIYTIVWVCWLFSDATSFQVAIVMFRSSLSECACPSKDQTSSICCRIDSRFYRFSVGGMHWP